MQGYISVSPAATKQVADPWLDLLLPHVSSYLRYCDHSLFVDSKILTHRKRLELRNRLHDLGAQFGLGIVSEQKIDEINILQASLLAMQRAVENLAGPAPDFF